MNLKKQPKHIKEVLIDFNSELMDNYLKAVRGGAIPNRCTLVEVVGEARGGN